MKERPMKALSIRQPWAWLICAGYKNVENRDRPTNFRGRIYVHAGKQPDVKGAWSIWGNRHMIDLLDVVAKIQIPNLTTFWDNSAIIGEVDIIGCQYRFGDERDDFYSPWHEVGMCGFLLANPVLYEKPIPCKGKLGFFEPDFRRV